MQVLQKEVQDGEGDEDPRTVPPASTSTGKLTENDYEIQWINAVFDPPHPAQVVPLPCGMERLSR